LGYPERQEPASLQTYLAILRRRAWIIVICTVTVPAVAYLLAHRQTPHYAASADVLVNEQNLAAALTGINSSGLPVGQSQSIDTEATLASVPDVAARALALARLHDRSPDALLGQTSISANPNTNIIDFRVVDPSPSDARLLATSYARAFTRYRNELDAQPIVVARRALEATMASLAKDGRKDSALYESLLENDQRLQTVQTLQTGGAVIIRTAQSGVQVSPHPRRDAAIGLLIGLLIGIGLALGAEALDTRVRSTSELGERLGGLPLLARLPPPAKKMQRRDELVMVVQPKHNAAEAFRLLRANLDFVRVTGGDVRTILITSAIEREGKSTTAANLAIAEARSGRRVALLDLDLRRPYLDRFFRVVGAPGIADVVLGSVQLGQALQRVDLGLGRYATSGRAGANTNGGHAAIAESGVLDLLVSGPLPPDPGEFVASEQVHSILARLRDSYDTVLIDSPPVLRVGDALTLSSDVDGVIVVARLKTLRRSMLSELRRLLTAAPARKLGYVVTGPVPGARGSYGDAYSYGYGYSAHRSESEVPESSQSRSSGAPRALDPDDRTSEEQRLRAAGEPEGRRR
jgi:Mrp family chromosome partitioning ATPase/capsular polysaccharide biosynthesis protein